MAKTAKKKAKSSPSPGLATPTGPHTPISNVAGESAMSSAQLRVEPRLPKGAQSPKTAGGAESFAAKVTLEAAAAAPRAGFSRRLVDIGRASFRDPDIVLETVHGPDDRVRVTNGDPAKYPWSTNASLLITARDGSQWVGTGWFIAPRTLVTAGHCVYIKNSNVPGRDGWVKNIQVMPGRDADKLPFGMRTSTRFFSVQGWGDSGDENYDYGAIILSEPFPKDPGTIGFAVYTDEQLANMVANVAGYPADKEPDGSLWYDKKKLHPRRRPRCFMTSIPPAAKVAPRYTGLTRRTRAWVWEYTPTAER